MKFNEQHFIFYLLMENFPLLQYHMISILFESILNFYTISIAMTSNLISYSILLYYYNFYKTVIFFKNIIFLKILLKFYEIKL